MCRLDSFMGLQRLLPSSQMIKSDSQKSVMPAKAGNQRFNPGVKLQNLDSGVHRRAEGGSGHSCRRNVGNCNDTC